jgi:hypothetical protein
MTVKTLNPELSGEAVDCAHMWVLSQHARTSEEHHEALLLLGLTCIALAARLEGQTTQHLLKSLASNCIVIRAERAS